MEEIDLFYKTPFEFDEFQKKKSEMTVYESAFLCGVIKKYRPKKIVEVGVAAGGSTLCIMNCLEDINLTCTVYSCDLNKKYYRNNLFDTGFVFSKSQRKYSNKHNFLLGKVLPEFLDTIGKDIDMVLLDTVHLLPGEILDFLAILPYLSSNAVVVLHDLCLNFRSTNSIEEYATKVLFDVAVSDNKIKFDDDSRSNNYSNIGMFIVDDNTKKYIRDVFSSLSISWHYYPSECMLEIYRRHFSRFYSDELLDLFNHVCNLQKGLFALKSKSTLEDFNQFIHNKEFYLYGTGNAGKVLSEYINNNNGKIKGFISSRVTERKFRGYNVYSVDEISKVKKENEIVLLALDRKFHSEIERGLIENNIDTFPDIKRSYEVKWITEVISSIIFLY